MLGPVYEDIFPGCGPLSGIHAALSNSKTQLNLIIAVDTPFLAPEFLSYLAQRAIESSAVVTTPEIDGYTQPLCTVYSLNFMFHRGTGVAPGQLQNCAALSKGSNFDHQRSRAAPVCLRRRYV